ncbi:MAG: PEP-CTERM sorting domain-containing protein [Pseudomonadota bacterium]
MEITKYVAMILAIFGTSVTHAALIVEVGDAGDTIGAAQSVGGGVDSISGALDFSAEDYLDLFAVSFSSSVTATVSSILDTEFLVTDTAGFVVASDDDSGGSSQPSVDLAAGSYLFGVGTDFTGYLLGGVELIAFNDNQGRDNITNLFFSDTAGLGPLTGSSDLSFGFFDLSGTYTIQFSSPTSPQITVPAPATLGLIGVGLIGLRRLRHQP